METLQEFKIKYKITDDDWEEMMLECEYAFSRKRIGSWVIEDVTCMAEQLGYKLTDKQAQTIFDDLEHGFDASMGMCWDTISSSIEDYFDSNPEEKFESLL